MFSLKLEREEEKSLPLKILESHLMIVCMMVFFL